MMEADEVEERDEVEEMDEVNVMDGVKEGELIVRKHW